VAHKRHVLPYKYHTLHTAATVYPSFTYTDNMTLQQLHKQMRINWIWICIWICC